MSKQRLVDTCYWDDTYVVDLDCTEKLLFLYLLTNPLTTLCGVYEISSRRMALDTGIDKDMVEKILARFERDGRCLYRNGWIAMRNWIKHQRVNPSVEQGIERELAKVPEALAAYVRGQTVPSLPPDCTQTVTDCTQDALLNSTQPNSTQPIGYPPEFEEWWKAYPRKVEKRGAWKKWEHARKAAGHAPLLTAAVNYARYVVKERTEAKFVKHPATFLGPSEPWRDWLVERKDKVETSAKAKSKGWECPACHHVNTHVGATCMECHEERPRKGEEVER